MPYLANPLARTPLPAWYNRAYGNRSFLGGQSPGANPLAATFNAANQRAVKENESRYLDVIGGLQGVRDRSLGSLADLSGQQFADANRNYSTSLNNQLSDLSSRGLSASSLVSSVTNASNRNRDAEIRRLKDDAINRQIATDRSLSGDLYGAMERRTDVQPDYNQLGQLSQGLGQAGILGGGFLGGGGGFGGMGSGGISGGGAGGYYGSTGFTNPALARRQAAWQARGGGGGFNPAPIAAGSSGYVRPKINAAGLDDVFSAGINRYDDRQQQYYAGDQGFGVGQSPYTGGGGFLGPMVGTQASAQYTGPVSLAQPQAATAGQRPLNPSGYDPAGDARRAAIASGADPWYSTPDRQVYNPEATLRLGGDPRRYARTRTVVGANTAGANVVTGNPVTGFGGQYSSFDSGGFGGGYGGGFIGAPPARQGGGFPTNQQFRLAKMAGMRTNAKAIDVRRLLTLDNTKALRQAFGFLY